MASRSRDLWLTRSRRHWNSRSRSCLQRSSRCVYSPRSRSQSASRPGLPPPPLRSKFCCRQGQGPAAASITKAKVVTVIKVKVYAVDKVKVPLLAQSRRSWHQTSSRSKPLLPSRSRSGCRKDQGPATAFTETKVKVQLLPPPRRSRPPESSRSGFLKASRSRFLLSPPPTRAGPCCHEGQGLAAAITTDVNVTTDVRGKTPAVNIEVKVPVAAETKVEKFKPLLGQSPPTMNHLPRGKAQQSGTDLSSPLPRTRKIRVTYRWPGRHRRCQHQEGAGGQGQGTAATRVKVRLLPSPRSRCLPLWRSR